MHLTQEQYVSMGMNAMPLYIASSSAMILFCLQGSTGVQSRHLSLEKWYFSMQMAAHLTMHICATSDADVTQAIIYVYRDMWNPAL